MSKSRILKNDFTKLNQFLKGVEESDKFNVRVGILGKKTHRTADSGKKAGVTNAELGLVHELGSVSRGIPARSFLRMPLHQKSDDILQEARPMVAEKLFMGDTVGALKTIGVACENAIQDAFGSRGFGTWAPNAPSTIAAKGSDAPLIDQAQLRKSITSDVKKKGG